MFKLIQIQASSGKRVAVNKTVYEVSKTNCSALNEPKCFNQSAASLWLYSSVPTWNSRRALTAEKPYNGNGGLLDGERRGTHKSFRSATLFGWHHAHKQSVCQQSAVCLQISVDKESRVLCALRGVCCAFLLALHLNAPVAAGMTVVNVMPQELVSARRISVSRRRGSIVLPLVAREILGLKDTEDTHVGYGVWLCISSTQTYKSAFMLHKDQGMSCWLYIWPSA